MPVRHPRPWVKIGGSKIPALDIHVTRKAERSADRFTATISLTMAKRYGLEVNDFADWQPRDVEIIASLAAGGATSRPSSRGKVDEPEIQWKDMTVTLQGRDKSASLTEMRRSEKFANQKTEDIVSKIAKDHGLTPHVQAGSPFAGKIYTQDHAHLVLNRPDYDVLSDLADREGCRWYVDGTDLYFEPRDAGGDTVEIFWYPPGTAEAGAVANIRDLQTRRNMTAARPHRMRHRSWHHYDAEQHEATAEMDGVGDPIEFEHHHNGKKHDQVQALAEGRLKNATRHDLSISVEMALDLSVTPRKRCKLSGTGTIYDQAYDIDGVELEIGWERPAIMRLECKSAKDGRKSGQGVIGRGCRHARNAGAAATTNRASAARAAERPRWRGSVALMDEIIDMIRREVAMAFAQRQGKGTLIATSYDPDKHAVKGIIMPHKVESGWIPLGAIHVGNGHGILVGPKVGSADALDGDQFDVHFENGDPNTPIAAHRLFSVKGKAPRVESGEMLLKHEMGLNIMMAKDGSGAFTHGKGSSFAFDASGNQTVNTNNLNLTVDAGSGSATYKGASHSFTGDISVTGKVNATQSVNGQGGVTSAGAAVRTV